MAFGPALVNRRDKSTLGLEYPSTEDLCPRKRALHGLSRRARLWSCTQSWSPGDLKFISKVWAVESSKIHSSEGPDFHLNLNLSHLRAFNGCSCATPTTFFALIEKLVKINESPLEKFSKKRLTCQAYGEVLLYMDVPDV